MNDTNALGGKHALSRPAREALDEADKLAIETIEELYKSGQPLSAERDMRVFAGLLHKAVQTVRGIQALAHQGCGDEAHALLRPLLETSAILEALSEPKDDKERADRLDRYVVYCDVQLGRWIDAVAGTMIPGVDSVEAIDKAVTFKANRPTRDAAAKDRVGDAAFKHFKAAKGWFPDPKGQSAAVGLREYLESKGALAFYVTIFKLASSTLHASDYDDYIEVDHEEDGGIYRVLATLTTSDVSEYLGTGTVLLFLTCLYGVSKRFVLGLTHRIEALRTSFIAARPDAAAPQTGPWQGSEP